VYGACVRAGPLSNETIISLLNSSFVAVRVDGVYLSHNEAASSEEKAAYRRLFEEFSRFNREAEAKGAAKASIGSVHAYILASDGRAFDSLHVAEAKASRVLDMLRCAIDELKPKAGEPVAKPAAQAAPPKAPPGSLVPHLIAKWLPSFTCGFIQTPRTTTSPTTGSTGSRCGQRSSRSKRAWRACGWMAS